MQGIIGVTVNIILFIGIFGSILFIAYVTTRYIGNKTSKMMKGKYISIIDSISIGFDKNLHIVKAGDQFILLASSGKNIEYLTTVAIEDYYVENNNLDNKNDFKKIVDKYLNVYKDFKKSQGSSKRKVKDIDLKLFNNNLNKIKHMNIDYEKQLKKSGDENTE